MALHGTTPTISAAKPTVVTATPTTGQTVTLPDQIGDMIAYITPAGTLVALTIALPSDAATVTGQVIRVFVTQAITTLTITNVSPAIATLSLNGSFTLQKVAANAWARF